ncbi:hypothetical protein TRFO_36409 [Tritrichomonas foetus]|uniref:Uncharacterized protein n=1 Tax=Tritrichomonas foetus TaxID=1144522 RepID=A0A1J4JIL9_9EUKA|nr:hypothetical protein TRFO_36409 [Tritrichomonas foetus]|eukprot:OHS97373.1 hypothetical protein TRFO_36409 [Tritrichomonas foetus]
MVSLVSRLDEALKGAREENDIVHALFLFQNEISPFTCSTIGRKQLISVFEKVWWCFARCYSFNSSSVRYSAFSAASHFLKRMSPFFARQMRLSLSAVVKVTSLIIQRRKCLQDPQNLPQNDQTTEKSENENEANQNSDFNDNSINETSNDINSSINNDDISSLIQDISDCSNEYFIYFVQNDKFPGHFSILLSAAFSYITNFISPELMNDFLEKTPIIPHFLAKETIESEHLSNVISNICNNNFSIEFLSNLLHGYLDILIESDNHGGASNRAITKAILAVISHSPRFLMNDLILFCKQHNFTSLSLMAFLISNLEGKLSNKSYQMEYKADHKNLNDKWSEEYESDVFVDLYPLAEIALNSLENYKIGNIEFENALQILSAKETGSYHLNIEMCQNDEESIAINLIRDHDKLEKENLMSDFLSDEDITQIMEKAQTNMNENGFIEISESENFGFEDKIIYIKSNNHNFDSNVKNNRPQISTSQTMPSQISLNSNLYTTSNQSIKKSMSTANYENAMELPEMADSHLIPQNENENPLFKSHEPIKRFINKGINSTLISNDAQNEVKNKIIIKFQPLLKIPAFYSLPLPMKFLIPKSNDSLAIISSKLNSFSSLYSDMNEIYNENEINDLLSYFYEIVSAAEKENLNENESPKIYNTKISAVLQALSHCVNSLLMNCTDCRLSCFLRKLVFPPKFISWFHAADVLRLISSLSPSFITCYNSFSLNSSNHCNSNSFYQTHPTAAFSIKEIVETVLNVLMMDFEKLNDICLECIINLANEMNSEEMISICFSHANSFDELSVKKHFNIIYEISRKFNQTNLIQFHSKQIYELLHFYCSDLETVASLLHVLSCIDDFKYSPEDNYVDEIDIPDINDMVFAYNLAKLVVNSGLTYLIGLPKNKETSLFYEKIEYFINSQAIEIDCSGITNFHKILKCIHAPMMFIFKKYQFFRIFAKLPLFVPNSNRPLNFNKQFNLNIGNEIEDNFIHYTCKRLFIFFPQEVTDFLITLFAPIQVLAGNFNIPLISDDKQNIIKRNHWLHEIISKLELINSPSVLSKWCELFLKIRKSVKINDKNVIKIKESVTLLIRNSFPSLSNENQLNLFINFLFTHDKTSNLFILRVLASLKNKTRNNFFKVASNPIRIAFIPYLDSFNEIILDDQPNIDLLGSNFIVNELFEFHNIKQFYSNEMIDKFACQLTGWKKLRFLKFINTSTESQIETSNENEVLSWRPFNPYFCDYQQNDVDRLKLILQSDIPLENNIDFYLGKFTSQDILNSDITKISNNLIPSVIRHLHKNEPNSELLTGIIDSFSISDILNPYKEKSVFEAILIAPMKFLQEFQIATKIKKKHIWMLCKAWNYIKSADPLLFALLLRSFENCETKPTKVKFLLMFTAVLLESTNDSIPPSFHKVLSGIILDLLNTQFLNEDYDFDNDSQSENYEGFKGLNLHSLDKFDQIGFVLRGLSKKFPPNSFDTVAINKNTVQNQNIEINNLILNFHENYQSVFSPTFSLVSQVIFSQISSISEQESKRIIKSFPLFESFSTLPSILIKEISSIKLLIDFSPNSINFIKSKYQEPFNKAKEELINPYIAANILNLAIVLLKERNSSYSPNKLNTFSFSHIYVKEFCLNTFFKNNDTPNLDIFLIFLKIIWSNSLPNDIKRSNSISDKLTNGKSNDSHVNNSDADNSTTNSLMNGNNFRLNGFVSNLISNLNGDDKVEGIPKDVEFLSLSISFAESVITHPTSFKVFCYFIDILRIYLLMIHQLNDRKRIILNSIRNWIKPKIINQTCDSHFFIWKFLEIMYIVGFSSEDIILITKEEFFGKFEFYQIFVALSFFVKKFQNSNEERSKIKELIEKHFAEYETNEIIKNSFDLLFENKYKESLDIIRSGNF